MTMHPLMDEHMGMLDAQLDEVSERLITLGGAHIQHYVNLPTTLRLPMLKETTATAWKTIRHLLVGYRYNRPYAKRNQVTGEEGDDVTQDIFIGAKAH